MELVKKVLKDLEPSYKANENYVMGFNECKQAIIILMDKLLEEEANAGRDTWPDVHHPDC